MSFKVEQMEEKNMVKLVIESTAEEFEAGLNKAYIKIRTRFLSRVSEKVRHLVR